MALVYINIRKYHIPYCWLTRIRLDALVSGQQEPILQHEVPNRPLYRRRQYRRFRLRHPRLAQQDTERAKVQNRLLSIAKILKLGLMSGHNMPLNGLPDDNTIFLGKTMYNPSVYDKVRMFVAIELVEPLLRTDLNPAERATDTFRLASLLVHETAVRYLLDNSKLCRT